MSDESSKVVDELAAEPQSESSAPAEAAAEQVATDEVAAEKAMAFTTVHGDVNVSFPAGFGADVTIESRSEEIYSDFEVEVKPAQPKVRRDARGNGVSFQLEQALELAINGGGISVRIETLHGKVFIRESGK